LVDHAVVKFIRGPTSRIWSGARKLSEANRSASNVSARSHRSVSSSASLKGADVSMLKQYSVSIPLMCGETFFPAKERRLSLIVSESAGFL
jgi:hypothetical protein